MGQNFAGWAELTVTAPAGRRITLRYGELLNADGTLNPMTGVAGQVKGRRAGKDGVPRKIGGEGAPDIAWQSDTYIAGGRGRETYHPRFTFRGFRYVEVAGFPGRPGLDAIRGLRLHADVEDAGAFESSNARLNRIQAMTRRTFLSNLFSVQSDCPHREKFGYGGDIVATSDALMLNFDMVRFYEKAVTDWADSAREDGMLTDTAPFVGLQVLRRRVGDGAPRAAGRPVPVLRRPAHRRTPVRNVAPLAGSRGCGESRARGEGRPR